MKCLLPQFISMNGRIVCGGREVTNRFYMEFFSEPQTEFSLSSIGARSLLFFDRRFFGPADGFFLSRVYREREREGSYVEWKR